MLPAVLNCQVSVLACLGFGFVVGGWLGSWKLDSYSSMFIWIPGICCKMQQCVVFVLESSHPSRASAVTSNLLQ